MAAGRPAGPCGPGPGAAEAEFEFGLARVLDGLEAHFALGGA